MQEIADRVLRLIEASGLSRRAFGQRIGLDDSKLSKSLSGARRFSSLDLARIAELGDATVDWLVTGEEPALAVAARTTTGEARTALSAARRYATMRGDLASLGYPQPWRPLPPALPGVTSASSASYAEQGRLLAGDALIRVSEAGRSVAEPDLPALTEDVFGADVAVITLDEGFDGLAVASAEARLIVLATSQIPWRQRYTLAHELGHLLFGDDQEVHLDKDVFDRAQARDPGEARANGFAAAFLMPEATLRAAVGTSALTEKTFAALACDLKVSPSALAIRLSGLRLIDSGTCDRFKAISGAKAAALDGRGDEYARWLAQATTTRPPGLLVRDAYAAYESGAATLRPYANLLGVDVDDLRRALESDEGVYDIP
jgi:Zn-dependent peptidase ImmA (M78 family)/transcriptional regulator with XRE-family HTH domain